MRLDEAYRALNLVQDYVPRGNSNRPGTALVATSITIHNTDNSSPGAGAAAHARYQKGPDAQKRKVSWHFTVDDNAVYQSLPTNEIGWHTATYEGNHSSIGIEICMNEGLDVEAAYRRAALLVALVARKERIAVPTSMFQHHDWSGKNCPIVLRSKPNGWATFQAQVRSAAMTLTDPDADDLEAIDEDSHNFPAGVADTNGNAAPIPVALVDTAIAWGRSVTTPFKAKVKVIAERLECDPSHLMAAMAFETGERFTSDVRNGTSRATGLIQFMPATAISLGTTVEDLAQMTVIDQLDWVETYLKPFRGRMRSLSDVYMTILYPAAVGKPDASVLFAKGSRAYEENRGLDVNADGQITKGEAASKVQSELDRGLSDTHRG